MSSHVVSKRVVGLSAAFIIALSAGTAGLPAMAQPAGESGQTQQNSLPQASLIDPASVYTLNVNKRASNTTGKLDDRNNGTPLAGATFKIERLEGDITNQAAFNELVAIANAYNDGQSAELPALTQVGGTVTTGADGVASFGNLAPGAYLVTETETPTGEDGAVYVPSSPFVVLVPSTAASGNEWSRTVDVYPKNSFMTVDKQV